MGTSAAPSATIVDAAIRRPSADCRATSPAVGRGEQPGADQDRQRRDFQHDQHVQDAAARLDAEVVDDREQRRARAMASGTRRRSGPPTRRSA